jgi:hypothetical protein
MAKRRGKMKKRTALLYKAAIKVKFLHILPPFLMTHYASEGALRKCVSGTNREKSNETEIKSLGSAREHKNNEKQKERGSIMVT